MIKPSDIEGLPNLVSIFEQEIDDRIYELGNKTGLIRFDMLTIPSFYPSGWNKLKPQYEKYWEVIEHCIGDVGNLISIMVTFVPKVEKVVNPINDR